MLFITSFALSLLTLTAGMFLLMKSKQDQGKFFRIMSWIIISLGILAVLMSVHLAMYKHMMQKHYKEEMMEHSIFFHHRSPMGGFDRMDMMQGMSSCDKGDGMKCCSEEKKACDTKCCNPEMESKAIMKIITDNVKLTPDQEKTISLAIEQSCKACCSATDKDKPCCTKEKEKDGKEKETK
jgi:hypothetical protein